MQAFLETHSQPPETSPQHDILAPVPLQHSHRKQIQSSLPPQSIHSIPGRPANAQAEAATYNPASHYPPGSQPESHHAHSGHPQAPGQHRSPSPQRPAAAAVPGPSQAMVLSQPPPEAGPSSAPRSRTHSPPNANDMRQSCRRSPRGHVHFCHDRDDPEERSLSREHDPHAYGADPSCSGTVVPRHSSLSPSARAHSPHGALAQRDCGVALSQGEVTPRRHGRDGASVLGWEDTPESWAEEAPRPRQEARSRSRRATSHRSVRGTTVRASGHSLWLCFCAAPQSHSR